MGSLAPHPSAAPIGVPQPGSVVRPHFTTILVCRVPRRRGRAPCRFGPWVESSEIIDPAGNLDGIRRSASAASGDAFAQPDALFALGPAHGGTGLVDEILVFKAMKTGSGPAFALYTEKMDDTDSPLIPVAKR